MKPLRIFRHLGVRLLVPALLALPAVPAHADLSPGDLPDMGNLGALITRADPAKVEAEAYAADGSISSGLPAPDTARGETARWIAEGLSGGDEDLANRLEQGLNDERDSFEASLRQAGFDTSDMGVALSACFIMLWETASDNELPLDQALRAGKMLVASFAKSRPTFENHSEADKAEALDMTMATAITFVSLIKGFEKEGRQQEADTMRQQAGTLFEDTFKLPHEIIALKDNGDLDIDAEEAIRWQDERGIPTDW